MAAASVSVSFSAGDVAHFSESDVTMRFEKLLGTGAFGEVWKCMDLENDKVLALKTVSVQDVEKAREEARKHRRAFEIAGREFVPELYFCEEGTTLAERPDAVDQSLLGIGMLFIDGCSMGSLLRKQQGGTLERYEADSVVKDVFIALARLHEHGIVHCDVKSDNLMVSRKGECYLCDFGVATFLEDHQDLAQPMPVVGTPSHMAPELVRTSPVRFDSRLDVWSAGILCFEVAVGRTPWHDEEDGHLPAEGYIFDMLKEIEGIDVSMVPFQGPYSRMLEDCLQVDPEERASAKDILTNPQFLRITAGQRESLGQLV